MVTWIARGCALILASGILLSDGVALGDMFPDPSIPQNNRSGTNRYNGLKKSLYFVVHDVNDPFTASEWQSRVASIRSKESNTRDFYAENSGGNFDIYYEDIIDAGITLNADGTRPSNFYTLAGNIAVSQGKNPADYYMFAFDVDDTQAGPNQGWAGLSINASSGTYKDRIYLQSTSQNVIDHEIGHQVGADHAKAFSTQNNSNFHPYTYNEQAESYQEYLPGTSDYDPVPFGVASYEYANPFDVMGNIGTGDFRIREKVSDLGWIPSSQFPRVDGDGGLGEGTHRIYAHDELQAVTNSSGDYGVAEGYDPNVNYGLTYRRTGQSFDTDTGTFDLDIQTIDIEYRSNADGAYFYLDGVLVDLDSQTLFHERLLEVGRSIEDTDFGMSTFIVNAGQVGQGTPDVDFMDFDPPAPTLLAPSWFHITASGTGSDSIGSYIDLTFEEISPLNGIEGDLNQDTLVNMADLDLFIDGWLTDTSTLSSVEKYFYGDMNFNGLTDLQDAHLMRLALLDAGFAAGQFGNLTQVPEPNALLVLCAFGTGIVLLHGRRSALTK